MGWNDSLFPLLIVVATPSSFSGSFTYSPSTGPGNLITSNAAGDGTDPYGNAYVHGLITYTTAAGLSVAYGLQDGNDYFATAPTYAGPYTVASGPLRSIGSYANGFTSGLDVNGQSYPAMVTQLDLHTIVMAGRVVCPAGFTSGMTFGTLGAPFVLPAAGANVPEFPTTDAVGGATGTAVIRPNGNLQLWSNQWAPGFTVVTSGAFRF